MTEIQVLMRWGWALRPDGLCARCQTRPHKVATEARPSDSCVCVVCIRELADEFMATYN
jgi:hypothetical protein